MFLKYCLLIALTAVLALYSGDAHGQNPIGRPPVYDLFRAQTGILPNYYQFYLPRQQLQRTLQVQDYQLQRQGTAIRAMQNQWQQAQVSEQKVLPTGSRSVYMNYSHFYPGLSGKPAARTQR